jgi:hypothetical protein
VSVKHESAAEFSEVEVKDGESDASPGEEFVNIPLDTVGEVVGSLSGCSSALPKRGL